MLLRGSPAVYGAASTLLRAGTVELSKTRDGSLTRRVRQGARRRDERFLAARAAFPGTLRGSAVQPGYWLRRAVDDVAAGFVLQPGRQEPALRRIQRRNSGRYGL